MLPTSAMLQCGQVIEAVKWLDGSEKTLNGEVCAEVTRST